MRGRGGPPFAYATCEAPTGGTIFRADQAAKLINSPRAMAGRRRRGPQHFRHELRNGLVTRSKPRLDPGVDFGFEPGVPACTDFDGFGQLPGAPQPPEVGARVADATLAQITIFEQLHNWVSDSAATGRVKQRPIYMS